MGRFMEAMVVCKKGVKAHPDDPSARVLLARVYADQGKDRKALEELQAILAAYPTFAAANRMAGVLHMRVGETGAGRGGAAPRRRRSAGRSRGARGAREVRRERRARSPPRRRSPPSARAPGRAARSPPKGAAARPAGRPPPRPRPAERHRRDPDHRGGADPDAGPRSAERRLRGAARREVRHARVHALDARREGGQAARQGAQAPLHRRPRARARRGARRLAPLQQVAQGDHRGDRPAPQGDGAARREGHLRRLRRRGGEVQGDPGARRRLRSPGHAFLAYVDASAPASTATATR